MLEESIPLSSSVHDDTRQPTTYNGHTMKRKVFSTTRNTEIFQPSSHSDSPASAKHARPDMGSYEGLRDIHANAHELRRSKGSLFLLVLGDAMGILLWTAVLLYVCLMWYANGKLVSNIPFKAHTFAESTRVVSRMNVNARKQSIYPCQTCDCLP